MMGMEFVLNLRIVSQYAWEGGKEADEIYD